MSKGEPGVHTRRWTTSSEYCSGNAQPVTVVSLVRCEVLQVLSKCNKDVLFRSPRGNMLIKVLASWPENERIKKEKIAPCRFTPRSDRTTTRLLNVPWVTGCLFVAVYVWERERESTGESHANYFTNTLKSQLVWHRFILPPFLSLKWDGGWRCRSFEPNSRILALDFTRLELVYHLVSLWVCRACWCSGVSMNPQSFLFC